MIHELVDLQRSKVHQPLTKLVEGAMEAPMALNSLIKALRAGARALAPLLAAAALAGCVTSQTPILGDARAILGDRIQVHAFGAAKEGARDHAAGIFEWSGSRYLRRSGPANLTDFTVHPYEGRDLIIQSRVGRAGSLTQYGLARRIADGVYLVIPISEQDADEGTRERFCTKTEDAACRVVTPEQLFVFARATAAKDEEAGGIAVVLAAPRR
jgi:hypothetical protein